MRTSFLSIRLAPHSHSESLPHHRHLQRELEAAQKLEMESEEIDIGQLIEEERQRLPTTG